jgi:hypothetical protein
MLKIDVQQKVVDTIRDGDTELLKELIASEMLHVNSELYNGQTPLGMAISQQKVQTCSTGHTKNRPGIINTIELLVRNLCPVLNY